MFVVCIGAGLGNQMFQYAFYCALKKHYQGTKITVDICNFLCSTNRHNGYELERVFGLKLPVCDKKTAAILADYAPHNSHKILNKLFQARRILFGNKDSFITQDDPTVYYPDIFKCNPLKSYMFHGSWINEDYFQDCRQTLLEDFTFVGGMSEKNDLLLQRIKAENAVSIHVRRGDYLQTKMRHLDKDYYTKAVALIEEKIPDPVFYIFSDDPSYVKEEFTFIAPEKRNIVDWNKGTESFRDLQLMSCCKHNIVANSTFSFWGAYLNQYENRMIIAPEVAADGYLNPFACRDWILI